MRLKRLGWSLPFALAAAVAACDNGTPPTTTVDVVTADDVEDAATPEDTGTPQDNGSPGQDVVNPQEDVVNPTDTGGDPDVVNPTDTGGDPDVVMTDDTPDAAMCPTGQIECGGMCVDPTVDNANCGVCGRACGTGQMCAAGMCQCPMGQMFCNGACVDLQSDPANCGGCGTACMTGQRCTAGTCAASCDSPNIMCGSACVNPETDNANCGGCDTPCAAGQTCSAGVCNCAGGQRACTAGGVTTCVNTQTDNANCGDCGNACGAGQTCTAGVCACPMGQDFCGSGMSGACVNTQTDTANCGACGNACPAGRSCFGGSCQCPSGQTACTSGGTETCVDTSSDNANCGACGVACGMGQTCSGGMCRCAGSQTACGGTCVNTQTDTANCGACGTRCAMAQTCVAGACRCPSGQSLCGGACVDTFTSNSDCGMCGNACVGTQTCMSGACRCPAGQTACGSGMSATCVNAQTDNANCGMCGNACTNGRSCVAGACACPSGQTFCGSGTTAACTNTQTDNRNCGACGRACTGGASCAAGACVMRPPNDDRTGAIRIDVSVPARTLSADTQNATPSVNGGCRCANGRDLYYVFTLTREEIVYADTFGSAFDTALFLQNSTGTTLTTANLTGGSVCNDDSCGGLQSQIVARLAAGTYYLVLSGCSQGQATIHFHHLPVGGTARQLSATTGTTQSFSSTLTGTSAVTGSCCSNGSEHTYWLATCPNFAATTMTASTCDDDRTNTTLDQRSATRSVTAQCGEGGCGLQARTTHALPSGAGLHTLYVDSCSTSRGSGDYTLRVTLGACASGTTLCGSNRCANLTNDSQNCGSCGTVCTGGRSCVNRVCTCPSGTTLCNGTCISTTADANHCGGCNVRCSSTQLCVSGTCQNRVTGQSFRIGSLAATSCAAIDTNASSGDQRGGIAVSPTRVFNTGDTATIRAALSNLATPTSVGGRREGILSNLRTGDVYVLATSTGIIPNNRPNTNTVVTRLLAMNTDTGALTTTAINLSSPITLNLASSSNGVYSGYDRVVIYNGSRVYHIALPTGVVTDLGALTMPTHRFCETFANYGVAEFFGGEIYLAYITNSTTISRVRVSNGAVSTVATFTNLGDMCSFVVSPLNNRWYFAIEGANQFRTGTGVNETLGYCAASWTNPDDTFRMSSFTASSCIVNPTPSTFVDDRASGIAVSSTTTYSSGDGTNLTIGSPTRWSANDLSGPVASTGPREGWVSNLATRTVYVAANNTTPIGFSGGTMSTLVEVDQNANLLTTRLVRLSQSITLRSSANGIFSGWNRVIVWNGSRIYDISLPNGSVRDLGALTLPTVNNPAAGSFFSGVAEYFSNQLYVDYVGNGTNANRIIRVAVPSGSVSTLTQFTTIGAMQNLTFSPLRNRWYFIIDGASQFRALPAGASTGTDVVGSCSATFTRP